MNSQKCEQLFASWAQDQQQAETRVAHPLDPLDIDEIRGRLEAATPGPWEWTADKWNDHRRLHYPRRVRDHWFLLLQGRREYFDDDYESKVMGLHSDSIKGNWLGLPHRENMELIAHAPTDLARLCDALEAAWAENAELRQRLKESRVHGN